MSIFQKNDYGILIETTIRDRLTDDIIDLNDVDSTTIIFKKPDREVVSFDATISFPSGGIITYVVESGLLNKVGVYSYQYTLDYGDSARKSDVGQFRVVANIESAP